MPAGAGVALATAALLLAGALTACGDTPDPRVWTSSALFLQRDSAEAAPIDTTGLPDRVLEQLRASGVRLAGPGNAARIRFTAVRAGGGGVYEVDARFITGDAARGLRLIVECGSRHCLVMDTVAT